MTCLLTLTACAPRQTAFPDVAIVTTQAAATRTETPPTQAAPTLAHTALPTASLTPSATPGTVANTPTPAPSFPVTVSDSGFRVNVDGFSFENYGNEDGVKNLTAVEMRQLFGDVVCAGKPKGDSCTLSPIAREWMALQNTAMDDGHCEGMAVLSSLLFLDKHVPTGYGSDSVFAAPLLDNAPLQRDIARWFVTQDTSPGADTVITGTPTALLDQLRAAFNKPRAEQEFFILGIYKRGSQPDGHALTPFAVQQIDANGRYHILVYDSNYPGETRAVLVDTIANTYAYTGSPNPKIAEDVYDGDAESFTMDLTSIAPRLGVQECVFCNGELDDAVAERGASAPRTELVVTGDGVLTLITNARGQRLGKAQDSAGTQVTYQEIPGGTQRPRRVSGNRTSRLNMPADGAYTVTLDGSALTATQAVTASVLGRGYMLAVEEITLDPGQKDVMSYNANTSLGVFTMTYQTAQAETPVLLAGLEGERVDYAISFAMAGDAAGQHVELVLNTASGTVSIRNRQASGTGDSAYSLSIERFDENGDATEFEFEDVPSIAGSTHRIRYDAIVSATDTLTISVDANSTGVSDQVLTLEAK